MGNSVGVFVFNQCKSKHACMKHWVGICETGLRYYRENQIH